MDTHTQAALPGIGAADSGAAQGRVHKPGDALPAVLFFLPLPPCLSFLPLLSLTVDVR